MLHDKIVIASTISKIKNYSFVSKGQYFGEKGYGEALPSYLIINKKKLSIFNLPKNNPKSNLGIFT